MEQLICNKCFVPLFRGKQPFNITQCGHIICQDCLQRVEKQCPLCGTADVMVLSLKEPLLSQLTPFCTLFSENFETLTKANRFKQDQIKIIMQRFNEIDKKYEALKILVTKERQYLKILNYKNINLKAENEKLSKKLSEMNNQQTFCAETPISDVSMHSANPKYSTRSLNTFSTIDITPMNSVDSKKQ